jgi:hypothetical protein
MTWDMEGSLNSPSVAQTGRDHEARTSREQGEALLSQERLKTPQSSVVRLYPPSLGERFARLASAKDQDPRPSTGEKG